MVLMLCLALGIKFLGLLQQNHDHQMLRSLIEATQEGADPRIRSILIQSKNDVHMM